VLRERSLQRTELVVALGDNHAFPSETQRQRAHVAIATGERDDLAMDGAESIQRSGGASSGSGSRSARAAARLCGSCCSEEP